MSYIKFNKSQLVNLAYSTEKELIRSNRAGVFAATTIINCNTRRYHGLFVSPIKEFNNENHVLLSAIDETIIYKKKEFHLSIRKYPNVFFPHGHKYINNFEVNEVPKYTLRIGDIIIEKENLLSEDGHYLCKYTLAKTSSSVTLKLSPLLAFRNINHLTKANMDVNKKSYSAENGIWACMYENFPKLYMQTSKKSEYTPAPDWHYNIEYIKDLERGEDHLEDLFTPGFFEIKLKKGESVIFCAGTKEISAKNINAKFNSEIKKRTKKNNFEDCLKIAAEQFIVKKGRKTEIITAYPEFNKTGRFIFMSLPGLSISLGKDLYRKILLSESKSILNGLYKINPTTYDSYIDSSLWYFWALQKYITNKTEKKIVYQEHFKKMISIINAFRKGTNKIIKIDTNGLLKHIKDIPEKTIINDKIVKIPLISKIDYSVKINALWYNAIMFTLELAKEFNENNEIEKIENLAHKIEENFAKIFWNQEKKYLADSYYNGKQDLSLRPNQILACSLPYTIIDETKIKNIVDIIKSRLLTDKGLRTLSPDDPDYKGTIKGNTQERITSYYNGAVFSYMITHYCEAYLKIRGQAGISRVKHIYEQFEEEIRNHGIGTISEVFDGNPPHVPNGIISNSCSVAEILRLKNIIDKYE